VTGKFRNDPVDFGDSVTTVTPSPTPPSSFLQEKEGVGESVTASVTVTVTEVQKAVDYLSRHKDFLRDGFEQRFFYSMESRVRRSRSLTAKEKSLLLELWDVIKGLVLAEETANRQRDEFMLKARHPLAKVEPGHDKSACSLCREEAEAAKRAEEGLEQELREAAEWRAAHGR
jgi:hypothetical protein